MPIWSTLRNSLFVQNMSFNLVSNLAIALRIGGVHGFVEISDAFSLNSFFGLSKLKFSFIHDIVYTPKSIDIKKISFVDTL